MFSEDTLLSVCPRIQGHYFSLITILGFASRLPTLHLTDMPLVEKRTENMLVRGLKRAQIQTHTKLGVMNSPDPSGIACDFVPVLVMRRESIKKADGI